MRSFCGLSERFSCQSRQPQQRAGADGLMSSGGRKCPAGEIQVCERQQREHLGPVLGDAAIAHLAVAELALNDTEHMLDFRAHLAEPMIAGTLAGRQPAAGFGLLLHRPEHARRLRGALLRIAGVALVAKTAVSSSRTKRSITFASCTLPLVTPAVCTSPLSASTPTCAFMPKYHWLPFFDDDISGSRFCSLFFVEGDAAISVASTIVPPRSISPLASRCSATAAKIAFVRAWRSSRWRKLRIVVSSGTASRPSSKPQNVRIDWMS